MIAKKFRAWDIDHKCFIYLDLESPDEFLFGRHGVLDNTAIEPWEQWIGIQDKNGVDVYEGDILDHPLHGCVHNEVLTIKWMKNGFRLSNTDYIGQGFIFECIGNIHENPELLKLKRG